jgi:hypothetical protein
VGDALLNQRPRLCESRSIISLLFAGGQKFLQTSLFLLERYRSCSPLFAWVGVLLVEIDASFCPCANAFYNIAVS